MPTHPEPAEAIAVRVSVDAAELQVLLKELKTVLSAMQDERKKIKRAVKAAQKESR